MFTLAQFNPADSIDVPMLPDPPAWEVWLFERPWTPAFGLLVLAIGLAWFFNQRSDLRRGLKLAGAALGLAGVLVVVGMAVSTTREDLARQSRRLVGMVARAETEKLGDLLASDCTVMLGGQAWILGRQNILAVVEGTTGSRYKVAKASVIAEYQQAPIAAGHAGLTQLWVRLEGEEAGYFARSWWRISWRRDRPDQPWVVSSIDLMQIDGLGDPAHLRNMVPSEGLSGGQSSPK